MKIYKDFAQVLIKRASDLYKDDYFRIGLKEKEMCIRDRNHPSIGIYVGRNEGNPPAGIDDYLRGLVFREHPGLYYISNSAMGVVSGGGPYRALSPKSYFQSYGHDKFHSERGMPNVMNLSLIHICI